MRGNALSRDQWTADDRRTTRRVRGLLQHRHARVAHAALTTVHIVLPTDAAGHAGVRALFIKNNQRGDMNQLHNESEAVRKGRLLAPGMYDLNDLEIGDHFVTSGMTVTEAHVVNYAGVSGDMYDIHLDDVAAQQAGFPGRIAHGLLGLALTDGLKTRSAVRMSALATLGWNWSFRAPLMIGDRIHVEIEVVGKRVTKRTDRGIATLRLNVLNQHRTIVREGETLLLLANRP
jgi:acyl dehydratase